MYSSSPAVYNDFSGYEDPLIQIFHPINTFREDVQGVKNITTL